MKQYPPNYKSKEEFLKLDETSDEDGNGPLESIHEMKDESDDNYRDVYKNNTKGAGKYGNSKYGSVRHSS